MVLRFAVRFDAQHGIAHQITDTLNRIDLRFGAYRKSHLRFGAKKRYEVILFLLDTKSQIPQIASAICSNSQALNRLCNQPLRRMPCPCVYCHVCVPNFQRYRICCCCGCGVCGVCGCCQLLSPTGEGVPRTVASAFAQLPGAVGGGAPHPVPAPPPLLLLPPVSKLFIWSSRALSL
jgi:hypothetical protein